MPLDEETKRPDPREAVRRDRARLGRREKSHQSFWNSLEVIGMVGWPIALGSVGGSFLGRYLDSRFNTGLKFTLMLMMLGVMLGSYSAWKAVVQKHD